MRPSDITDGIASDLRNDFGLEVVVASMRPSDITDGIERRMTTEVETHTSRFNEAVGYYRRNLC